MSRVLTSLVTLLAGVSLLAQAAPPPAQNPPPQNPQQPVFRAGVDVISLDVSVLDKDRRPVRGLKPEDFTVVENGKTQRIITVTEMAGADRDPEPSAWMRHVPPDVSANDLTDMTGDGRFVAIVMDDWNVPFDDHQLILGAREVGRYLVDQLSPSDVAAVIYPQLAGKTQDFTTDRQKLIAAIDKFDPPEVRYIEKRPAYGPGGGDMPQRFAPILMRSECQRSQPTVPTLDTVVARLATVPNRRKTVILVSTGLPVTFMGGRGCPAELASIMKDVFRRAQRANVNIYSVDPGGVNGYADYLQNPVRRGGRPSDNVMPLAQANAAVKLRRDFMEIMADHTGARAIVNTDDLGHEIDRMMAEASSYYLVGYETSNGQPDGKFRRLDVKVSRPGVSVRTRSGFYAPDESGTKDREGTPGSNELGLTGMASATRLALRSQVVAVSPSATNPKEVDIVVVLGVRTPGIRFEATDTLTLVRTLYDAAGKPGPPTQEKVPISAPAPGNEDLRYEVFQRLTLAPGRWELRINATSARLDTSGTVYDEFEVPDFSRRGLVLSSALIGQKVAEGRTDRLAGLIPLVPTTARDFAPGTAVTAYLRVLQGGTGEVAAVKMSVQVLNTGDAKVFESASTIEPAAFGEARSAPFEVPLPLDKLERGQYLLSIAAERADGAKTRSDVIFRVR